MDIYIIIGAFIIYILGILTGAKFRVKKFNALAESRSVNKNEGKNEFCMLEYTIDDYNTCGLWKIRETCKNCDYAK